MGLCIVSQRPAKVDKNIISQCNTNIILKVTNPNDLKAITASVEGLTSQTCDEIQRLPIGVALVSGAGLQMPIMAEIRTRETNHGGKSVGISKPGGGEEDIYKPIKVQAAPPPPKIEAPTPKPAAPKETTDLTDKARDVSRVANRLGWVNTDDPDEAIKALSKEAEKMNENVYKYLESLSRLGKNFCHPQDPKCIKCPMNHGCNYRASHSTEKKGLFRK